GLLQDGRSLLAQVLRRRPVELGEQAGRLVEMECPDLEQLVTGIRSEPVRVRVMKIGARGLRETRVCDFADEDVFELVRLLAADRGTRLAHREIAQEQFLERAVDVVEFRRKMSERAAH